MFRLAWMVALVCCSACGGCAAWPAFTAPQGTLLITKDSDVPGPKVRGRPHCVVLTYWDNQVDPSIDSFDALATDSNSVPFQFPLRMYAVIFSPALGFQHLSPEARLIVFAEGYEPAFSQQKEGDPRFCCGPPEQKLDVIAKLEPPRCTTQPVGARPDSYVREYRMLLANIAGVRWALLWGKGVTDQDRHMVYRTLERKAGELRNIYPYDVDMERAQRALQAEISRFRAYGR